MTAPDPWHSPTRPRVITLIDELPDRPGLSDYAAKMQVRRYLGELREQGISIDSSSDLPCVLLSSAEIKALMRAAYLDGRADEHGRRARPQPPPAPVCDDVEFAGVTYGQHGDVAFWTEQDGEVECFEIGWGHGGDRVVLADLRRTTAKPREPDTVGGAWLADHGCLCSHCRKPLSAGDLLRQQCIYKCGRLSYIALAHATCAPEYDNAGPAD